MRALLHRLSKLKTATSGATAVEYGLIAALMTVAMVGALSGTGNSTKDKWDGVADKVATASNG